MSQMWDIQIVKAAIFHPSLQKVIRDFPKEIRLEMGKAIRELQEGITLGMPKSRTMVSVAPGVSELRFKDGLGQFRVFYYTKHLSGILIFHAFTKKTQKTPAKEIEIGRKRLRELIHG